MVRRKEERTYMQENNGRKKETKEIPNKRGENRT
jgi:hypothetical protein